ncbi:hypothetical protein [Solimonas flava]|uniref:hypothetical protein n=1 Tax=Solimonas flava TaxID=415849 RepID=UPI0003F615F4|nr:hypothetical protein [Solimonas flava]
MTESLPLRHVVYVVEVAEKPGIVHALAAVFAHRGLSMRSFIADAVRRPPRILIPFEGTPRQCRLLAQVIARLHDVLGLRVLDAGAAELQASALCRLDAPPPALAGISWREGGDGTWQMSGAYLAVDRALAELAAGGQLRESFRTLAVL